MEFGLRTVLNLIAAAILALCLIAVMVNNFRNSKSKFVFTISGMMLIYALVGILTLYANEQYSYHVS